MKNPLTTWRRMHSVLLLTALFGGAAHGQSVLNGDFEAAEGIFSSWTTNSGASGALESIGGDFSARLKPSTGNNGNALNQNINEPLGLLSEYALTFDFAASDPGSASARSMQLSLRTVPGVEGGNINLRVVRGSAAGLGTLQVFSGSWNAALVDAVILSTSETGAGFYVNSMTIAGDYSETPFYTITVNGDTSADLFGFQSGAPTAGSTLKQISFQSGNLVAGSWSVVDNISIMAVPEPSVPALLCFGAIALIGRRQLQR